MIGIHSRDSAKTFLTAFHQIHEYPYRSYQIMNITISTHHLRYISGNLKVCTLCADLHIKGFPLSHTALTLSGTHLKKILKSFAVIVLGIDLLLIFGMTLVSSDPNLREFERLVLSISWKYFLLLCLIITITVCHLPFADDLILASETPSGLQKLIYDLEEFCKQWHMEVNLSKTSISIFNSKFQL